MQKGESQMKTIYYEVWLHKLSGEILCKRFELNMIGNDLDFQKAVRYTVEGHGVNPTTITKIEIRRIEENIQSFVFSPQLMYSTKSFLKHREIEIKEALTACLEEK